MSDINYVVGTGFLGDQYALAQYAGDLLTTGDESQPRRLGMTTTATGLASGQIRFTMWTARRTFVSTGCIVYSGGTAAGATPTLCRVGLWILSGTNWVPIATTANDTAMYASTTTAYPEPWQASVQWTAGNRYALGQLIVTAAATPTLTGTTIGVAAVGATSPRIAGLLSGQSDLPGTFADNTLSASGGSPYVVVT